MQKMIARLILIYLVNFFASEERYDLICNFTPIFFSTLRIFYVDMVTSEGRGRGSVYPQLGNKPRLQPTLCFSVGMVATTGGEEIWPCRWDIKLLAPQGWKNYNDQAYSCPRDWRLPEIIGVHLRVNLKPLKHHGTMVSKYLRALYWASIMPRDISFSDSRGKFFQFLHSRKMFLPKDTRLSLSLQSQSISVAILMRIQLAILSLIFFSK